MTSIGDTFFARRLRAVAIPHSRRTLTRAIAGYFFVLPALIVFFAFHFYPTLFVFYLSTLDWNFINPVRTFVGLDNFQRVLLDKQFQDSLLNTAYYALNVPLGMSLALLLAVGIQKIGKGGGTLRAIYFLPTLTPLVPISMVFMWLYDPDFGLINHILGMIGISGPRWLGSTLWAMPAMILLGVWHSLGYKMVIFAAGLSGIPTDLYEAATVDGASGLDKFRFVTWPLLMPVTLFILVTSTISSFQVFSTIYVMTQGGPLGSTTTVVYLIYQNAFQFFKVGTASAMAVVLLLLLALMAILQLRFVGRRTTYLG